MNVLHLCTKVPYPPKDGGSLATLAFVSLYRKAGYNVTILASNTPKHQVSSENPVEGVEFRSSDVDTRIKFFKLAVNFFFSRLPYNITRFRSDNFSKSLIQLLREKKFDIVQLEGPHLGVYLRDIRSHSSAKVILRAHNVEHTLWNGLAAESENVYKHYLTSLARRVKEFEARLISEVDGVIPISKHDLLELQSFSKPLRSIVIPFGINPDEYQPMESSLDNTLFFIGALDWIPNQKGLVWFLEYVWPTVKSQSPEVTFHIAGRNAPQWLISKMNDERIYFYGEIDDAKSFINRYKLMVIPLFSGSGVRVKILEGMALKKPIVTTTKGAEGLDITSGSQLIIGNQPDAFSNSILDLLTDNKKQKSLGEAARTFICKEFDNLALVKRLDDFCHKLVSE